jgi:hypothetical protein
LLTRKQLEEAAINKAYASEASLLLTRKQLEEAAINF